MTTEAQKKANKRYQEKRKAYRSKLGICMRCNNPVASNSYKKFVLCELHLAYNRNRYQRSKLGG